VLLVIFSWKPIRVQYRVQHEPPHQEPPNPVLFGAITNVDGTVSGLEHVLATNQSDTRMPILDMQKSGLERQEMELQSGRAQLEHELEDSKPLSLDGVKSAIDEAFSNSSALEKVKQEQLENDKKIQAIQDEKTTAEKADVARLDAIVQQQADEKLVKIEQILGAQILPMFNYLVTRLDLQLAIAFPEKL
jgi:hypothetical protein